MPQIERKAVEAQLKRGELSNCYYIFGQDVSSVEKLTDKIISAAVGDDEALALNRLDGKALDISEFRDMTEMMPMMSEHNCILVNDYNCEEQREDDIKQLVDALKNIPPHTVVIFNVTGFEVKKKYDKKTRSYVIADKNKKIADIAAKNGVLTECAIKTPQELAKDIAAAVSARGGLITLPNAREIAERCLSDTLAIRNEIDKLCAYTQGSEITLEIIDSMVHRQSATTFFELADAVVAMNGKAAFAALDELMQDKKNRGAVLGNITNSFLDLYRIQLAKSSGKNAETVKQDFEYFSRGFVIDKLYRSGPRMNIRRLRECIAILRDTAVKLNSSGGDEKIMLEKMVAEMLLTGSSGRK